MKRLPVAPRPFRDELLSSWLARVACRYGLEMRDLIGHWDDEKRVELSDIVAPPSYQTKMWAQACGVDPARVQRLSLARRYPNRPHQWFIDRARQRVPVCLACFDDDFIVGRDGYLRAEWMQAERSVCQKHELMLQDRCPSCHGHLNIQFQMREDQARVICGACGFLLSGRGGGIVGDTDTNFMECAFKLQRRIGSIVTEGTEQRERLEHQIATLWAPLDYREAVRPVLALWFEQPGWRCPSEVQHAVGSVAPFPQLPLHWRALTLVALHDLFGPDLFADVKTPAKAENIFRRAAPRRMQRAVRPAKARVDIAAGHAPINYTVLAHELLADPSWIAAERLSESRRRRIRTKLVDKVLKSAKVTGGTISSSPVIEFKGSPPMKCKFALRESHFDACPPMKSN